MKEAYRSIDFRESSLHVIAAANLIIDDLRAAGYTLTLRQLYYQFVANDLIENSQRSYNRLGSIVNDGRLAGLIDWDAIEDRTRNLASVDTWDHPHEIVEAAAAQFKLDPWANQSRRCEVWVEKEALAGVVERPARRWRVPFFCCRGYVSQSELRQAALRVLEFEGRTVIIHLGDHDPSGMDMTRDIEDRLWMFTDGDPNFEVRRIALNYDQIEEHRPPPNPAKLTDSRAASYIPRYGKQSWELDALSPQLIDQLIDREIGSICDKAEFERVIEQEQNDRESLEDVAARLRDEASA